MLFFHTIRVCNKKVRELNWFKKKKIFKIQFRNINCDVTTLARG